MASRFLGALVALTLCTPTFWMLGGVTAPALADTPGAAAPAPAARAQPDLSWVDRLQHQTGTVPIATAKANLNLGQDYYFIGAADSRRVLTEAWGNPPSAADNVLGMIFPKDGGPASSWGAVVTYDDAGYVSDDDAAKIDPDKLLQQLREGEAEVNEQRKKDGYDTLHLAGWAQPPSYDAATHSAVWAQDLDVNNGQHHTLNYEIRILGRRGVLSLTVIAPLSQLPEVQAVATHVRQLAAYDAGSRYADVDKANDKMAAYGVAGLIAAGVGVAAVKKLGFLALLLAFGKKAFVLIAAAFAGIAAWVRRMFGGNKLQVAKPAAYTPPPTSAPPPASTNTPPPPSDIVQ